MNLLIQLINFFVISFCLAQNEFEFDRKNVILLFNPLVAPLGYEAELARTTKENCFESDIFPLLEKIRTKFNTIAFKTTDTRIDTISYDCIPTAVARMNDVWASHGEATMKVWLVDSVAPIYVQTETDFSGRLENISHAVTQANSIFPGTVEGVYLDYYTYINDNSESQARENAETHLALFPKILGNDTKIGLILSNSYCRQLKKLFQKSGGISVEKTFIYKADVVLIADFEAEIPEDGTPAGEFALSTYTTCVDEIATYIHGKPEIGVFTAWTATSPSGVTSYKGFVDVWKALNQWATQRQKPLLMWGAFDDLPRSNVPWSTLGWWRLLPNSSYVHTSDYKFIEKKDLIQESNMLEDPMGNFTFMYRTPTNFSRELFGVTLDPFVHLFENGVKGRQVPVHALVRQVSTHFSRIRVRPVQGEEVHHSIIQLTSFAPKFNLDASTKNLVELILTFDGKPNFEKTLKLAEKANSKSPETVKLILLDTTTVEDEKFSLGDQQNAADILIHAQEKLSSSEIKIGTIVYSSACDRLAGKGKADGKNPIKELAPHTKIFYIFYYMQPARLHLGVERVVADLGASFEKCERRIRTAFPEIEEIGLITNWHDKDKDGKRQNFVQLVNFWEHLNAWAIKTNSKIFINEAIDNPNKENDMNQGWWRFVENKTLEDSENIVLEEKRQIPPPEMSSLTSIFIGLQPIEIVGICIAIATILLLIVAGNTYYLKKLKKQVLSKQELEEFFKGGNDETIAYDKAYDVDRLELGKEDFTIDDKRKLGSGEFGQVNFGKVHKKSEGVEKFSAVKTIRTGASNTALKGLLSEIKVLSYLGEHENIVSLLGAYTSELKHGKLYVFLELCEFGSLHDYLDKLRILMEEKKKTGSVSINLDNSYTNLKPPVDYRNVNQTPTNVNYDNMIDISNLASDFEKWSREIARGMEHLASKKVVHADLATRNVLLTRDKRARISDFGLSRRLYNYALYQKTQEEPLPWKWMAPESLKRMEFTEKTDVWAYGVTLWEIHSLGEVPFPGLSWELDFVNSLEQGLRMSKPSYCDDTRYGIMIRCWHTDPDSRPTFSELRKILDTENIPTDYYTKFT